MDATNLNWTGVDRSAQRGQRMTGRPQSTEAAPYYFTYIDQVMATTSLPSSSANWTIRWRCSRNFRGNFAASLCAGQMEHPAGAESRHRYGACLRIPSPLVRPRIRRAFARATIRTSRQRAPWRTAFLGQRTSKSSGDVRLSTISLFRKSAARGVDALAASRAIILSPCARWRSLSRDM